MIVIEAGCDLELVASLIPLHSVCFELTENSLPFV